MSYTITIGGTTINTTNDTKPYVLAKSLRIAPRADHRNECSFTIITTAATFLPKVGQELIVTESGVTKFGGIVKVAPAERPGAGTGNTTTIYVDVMSDGYSSIAARRTVTAWYAGKTCGYIVGKMITDYLADEGITAGTVNAGVTLSSYVKGATSIKEILDELADLSGYKWYIDDNKALQFLQEDTITAAAHDIVEGGVFTDFRDVQVEENLEMYRNKQFILGGVLGDGSTLVYSKQIAAEITARQAIEGGSGVYGNVFQDTNILTDADAEVAADNLLKKYGTVPITLTFNSDTNDWVAGTKLLVNLPTFGISTNTYFLIEEVTVRDLGGGNIRSYITATRRDGTSFSTQRTSNYVDYFADIVRLGKSGGAGGGGGSEQTVIFLTDTTDALVTLNTTSQEILELMFSLTKTRTLMVDVLAPLTLTQSCLVTMVCEVNNVVVETLTDYFFVDADADSVKHIFDASFPLVDTAASTSVKVTIKMKVSAGTATIASGAAYLVVAARGIEVSTVDLTPVIELDTLTAVASGDPPVATAVGTGTAQTSTPTTLAAVVAGTPTIGTFELWYSRYESGDDAQADVYGDNWEGQTFTPGANHTVNKVMLKCLRSGLPGTVTLEVYATDGSGLPTGAALTSGTFNGDSISDASAEEVFVTVTDYALTASTKYALVARRGGDASNKLLWRRDESSPTYTGGARVFSANAGVSWSEDTTRDYIFKEGNV